MKHPAATFFICIFSMLSFALSAQLVLTPIGFESPYLVSKDIIQRYTVADTEGDGQDEIWVSRASQGRIGGLLVLEPGAGYSDHEIITFSDINHAASVTVLSGSFLSTEQEDIILVEDLNGISLYNKDSGTLDALGTSLLYRKPDHASIIDIDTDGIEEFVFASTDLDDESHFFFYKMQPDGKFEIHQDVALDLLSMVENMAIADIDQDGDADVMYNLEGENEIRFLENNDGVFERSSQELEFSIGINTFISVDFDEDGDEDIAMISESAELYVLEKLDEIAYAAPRKLLSPVRLDSLIKAPKRLGGASIVVMDEHRETLYRYTYDSEAMDFVRETLLEANHPIYEYDFGHFNEDGLVDIATQTFNHTAYYYQQESGKYLVYSSHIYNFISTPNFSYFADDEDSPLYMSSYSSGEDLTNIAAYKSAREEGTVYPVTIVGEVFEKPHSVWAADLTGSGRADVMSVSDLDFQLFRRDPGTGSFQDGEQLDDISGLEVSFIDDVNNDEYLDIVAHLPLYYGFAAFINDGLHNLEAQNWTSNDLRSIHAGDYNQDGFTDVLTELYGWILFLNDQSGSYVDPMEIRDIGRDLELCTSFDNSRVKARVFASFSHLEVYHLEDERMVLRQEFLDQSFGQYRTVVDINNDGYDDLVIADDFELSIYLSDYEGYLTRLDHGWDFDSPLKLHEVSIVEGQPEVFVIECESVYYLVSGGRGASKAVQIQSYYDINNNGLRDDGEEYLSHQHYSLSDREGILSSGNQERVVTHFNFTDTLRVSHIQNSLWTAGEDSDVSIAINDSVDRYVLEYPLRPLVDRVDANIELSHGRTRCGFVVPAWINFQNTGSRYVPGLIELQLDELVSLVDSDWVVDSVSENRYYWKVDSIRFANSRIKIQLQMPGVEELENSISNTVRIYHDGVTPPVLLDSKVRISTIQCAYDPNDKLVVPLDTTVFTENYTLFGDTLEYTIRFQNTGTDTAFNVRLEDQLSDQLDWSSLQITGASHDYTYTLSGKGLLTIQFDDILLPDSTTNEILSHGSISFTIAPLADLPEETLVENTADIFFDFNPPIITNTTRNTYVSMFPVSTEEPRVNSLNIRVIPNPSGLSQTRFIELEELDDYRVEVYSSGGALLSSQEYDMVNVIELQNDVISSVGIYQVRVTSLSKGAWAFVKVVVTK